jgi:N utilization substance protein A
MTEDEESKRRSEEFEENTNILIEALNIDETMAQLLVAEGYNAVTQLAYAPIDDLIMIEGFSEELAKELQTRAIAAIEKDNHDIIENLEKLGVEQESLDILDLPPELILKLAEFGVKTLEDLAEVTLEEFSKIIPEEVMSKENANILIEEAKKHSV